MNLFFRTDNIIRMAWAYTGLILLLVALPINSEDQFPGKLNDNYVLQIRFDHLFHGLIFIPWVLMMGYGYGLYQRSRARMGGWYGVALAFAVCCEYLQLPLPYPTFNINDILANVIGVTLDYVVLWGWIRVTTSSYKP